MVKRWVMLAALAIALAPGAASADWLFTPNIGLAFNGSSRGLGSLPPDVRTAQEHLTYGASIGWMGAGVFGWEADFAFTPDFFADDSKIVDLIDTSNVGTFMVNAIIGLPLGGTSGLGFRPYFSGGIGLMRIDATDAASLFKIDNTGLAYDLGGGVMAFVTDRFGLRGDLRYVRQFSDSIGTNPFDIPPGDLDYWRATAGITVRW
jgi:opacity protein-like surface antigen